MKSMGLIPLLLLIPLFSLSAGNPLGLPQPAFPESPPYWLQFDNDALGLEIDGEWDDKSTFGFKGGIGFLDGRLMSALSYTSYTKRGGNGESPSRFDRMDAGLAWRAVPLVYKDWQLSLIPGGGIFFLGDLGGYEIQSHWHNIVNIDRPIPGDNSYIESDNGSVDTEAFAFAEFRLSPLHSPWIRFESALRMETTGWLFGNIRVAAGWEKTEKTQLISLLYQNDLLSYEESPFHPTAVIDDIRVALELRAGGLYVEKASSVFKERIDGSMGFIFGGDSFRELPSQGLTERMDAGSSAFRQSPFVRWGWELHSLGWERAVPNRFWLIVQYQSGWQDDDEKNDGLAERFSSVSAGLEYHFLPELLIHIDPYAALTSGICDFRELEAGLAEAETSDRELFLSLSPLLGIRIEFPSNRTPFTYSFGLEGGGMFRINDEPDFLPVMSFMLGCRLY